MDISLLNLQSINFCQVYIQPKYFLLVDTMCHEGGFVITMGYKCLSRYPNKPNVSNTTFTNIYHLIPTVEMMKLGTVFRLQRITPIG